LDIYIDVLVLENMVINYLILLVTSKFLRVQIKGYKAFLAALIGTIYVIIMLIIPRASFYFTFAGKIILSVIMILITFKVKNFKEFLKTTISFYISTFIFAGAAFAYIYMSGSGGVVQNGVYYIFKKSNTNMIIFASILAIILIKLFYETVFSKSRHGNNLVNFDITLEGKSLSLKGLIDTGNSLHDPISNLPVVVCELSAVREIIPKKLADIAGDDTLPDLINISTICQGEDWLSRVRLVPYSSLGKDRGMLLGIKPDKISIQNKKEERADCAAIICLYDKSLSSNSSYNALLSPDLITIT